MSELVENSLQNVTTQPRNLELEPGSFKRPFEPGTPTEFSMELKRVINERNILTNKTKKTVFEALDDIKKKNDEETRWLRKQRTLNEIINSERKYVGQLEIIIDFFMYPITERNLLSKNKFDLMFGNIRPIYNINKELLDEISKGGDNVAKAFSRIAPFLKMYSVYAFDYTKILKILHDSKASNPAFAKFVEDQETRPEVQNKLSALLITPIQRVPRYKLFLLQLHQLTKPHETDYNFLTDSLSKIKQVATHLNNIVGDQEKQRKILEYHRCLTNNHPIVISPSRYIIKEGPLTKMTTPSSPGRKMYVVLMNDIIIFNKVKKEKLVSNSLKISSIFPLSKTKVTEIADKGCLKIESESEELFLYHQQLIETKSWVVAIQNAITSHLQDKKTLRKESSARRPVKRKDVNEYNEAGVSPGQPLKKRRALEFRGQVDMKHYLYLKTPTRSYLFDAAYDGVNPMKLCVANNNCSIITNKQNQESSVSSTNDIDENRLSQGPDDEFVIVNNENEDGDENADDQDGRQNGGGGVEVMGDQDGGEGVEVMDVENGEDKENENKEMFVYGKKHSKQNFGGIKAFFGGVNAVLKRFLGIRK